MSTDTLVRNIKSLRKKNGLTQAAFASAIGINRGAYAHYENGIRPVPADVKQDIAAYYGISAADLDTADLSRSATVVVSTQAGMLDKERDELAAMSHPELVEHCLTLALTCKQYQAAYKGYKKIVQQIQNNVNSMPPNLEDL
ncbi:MAG: helix-turn-helix transcriptional regulator [Cyclobacteriaceae bacterium]